MIIVQMSGGLGNQMFQYALYRQLREQGKEVKIDDWSCYQETGARKKQLEVFDIKYQRASKQELIMLTDASMKFQDRVRRKLFGRKTKSYMEQQFNFDERVFTLQDAYLEGCWQTEKYFAGVTEQLHTEFCFHPKLTEAGKRFLEQIKQTESVGVHIRRGDYLQETYSETYAGICTDSYYEKAMVLMREKYPNSRFFLFSNDTEWVKKNMVGEQYVAVDCNNEEKGYLDMLLMSECKHNIVANSSFSWWAAWLNKNPDKQIIAPKKWLNGRDCSDVYTDRMLAI